MLFHVRRRGHIRSLFNDEAPNDFADPAALIWVKQDSATIRPGELKALLLHKDRATHRKR
jgi:hypothetical protein